MSSSEEGQYPEQSPKMSSGFQCFVCGKQFGTNEERIEHLEKAVHGSMYDTASPQEREDTRRLRSQKATPYLMTVIS
jgi:hypothetical protein